ncbi:D-sedoheptulose 7-phosphate isomerase [Flavobacteriaceae bacterium]|nr:D-sedoheptulose 7-phosphate isomerase [Flavobacteriaceae bacterium]
MIEEITNQIKESIDTKNKVLDSPIILEMIESMVEKSIESLNNGGKIIFCGNGGSFGDSQHLAAEFISRLRFDRSPLASIALGTNSSNLSAIGNDYGYEKVFTRELLALGKKEDVFIPISTSGNSPNVLGAIKTAKALEIQVFGLTGGNGGKMIDLCDCLIVPSDKTEKIQESHIMIGHIFCGLVESKMFSKR